MGKKFGERLRKLRLDRGWTQAGLASKMKSGRTRDYQGVSQPTVAGWEAGNRIPDLENILELARLFETTVEALTKGGVEN